MVFGRSKPKPSQLPTPPETDTDFLAGSHHTIDLMNAPGVADLDLNTHPSAGAPFRRVSTLAYHNSPFREPRERTTTTRQSRWLVVVIPPAWLVQEHGPFGHTLASGPPQRLAQGALMPLLPTMYGQLTAIAREFNFPSPVGLCIYLRIVEQGFTMTPRVSDETWPALWGHLFEARSPSAQQSPVCGQIEFDIERQKARWLDSWLTSIRRHSVDVPVSVPSSLSHWHGESKNSFDEMADEYSEVLPGARTRGRSHHIKKLSLVDKLETLSITSSVANTTTGNGIANELSLATILQEDEPKTAKKVLERRVHSWRASSSVAPTPIATTSQIRFDTVHIPDNAQLGNVEVLMEAEDVEPLDLNDFAWSVSSMGPPDHESLASALSSPRVSSVHLDRRAEGSVLLTPSTATSWGPKSLDYSPISTLFRLPSPDIGRRVTEDCPPTPSTVTSWGPEELLYSPASPVFRLPSPDLGQRVLEDCPPTPSTTTPWGPEELLFPPTSMVLRLPSPDLGSRALDDSPSPLPASSNCGPPAEDDNFRRTSSILIGNLVFPYFMASDCPAWTLVWPFYGKNAASCAPSTSMTGGPPVEDNRFNSTSGILIGNHVFPYFMASDRPAWTLTWPFYVTETESSALSTSMAGGSLVEDNSTSGILIGNHVFPYFMASDRPVWTLVWPFYEKNAASCPLSASMTEGSPVEDNSTSGILIGNHVFPYFMALDRPAWTLTWPFYVTEAVSSALSTSMAGGSLVEDNSTSCIPIGNHVFPYFMASDRPTWTLVWPFYGKNAASCALSTSMTGGSLVEDNSTSGILVGNHVYPYFMASDRPAWTLIWPFYGKNDAVSCTLSTSMTGGSPVEDNGFNSTSGILTWNYVFPYFTASDRPAWTLTWPFYGTETVPSALSSRLPRLYPAIEIYDVVYPHFELFPGHVCAAQEATVPDTVDSLAQRTTSASLSPRNSTEHTSYSSLNMSSGHGSVHLENGYPTLSIYPPVYPYLCIYPPHHADLVVAQDVEPLLVQNRFSYSELGAQYPSFNLYPASYPSNLMCIYPPAVLPSRESDSSRVESDNSNGIVGHDLLRASPSGITEVEGIDIRLPEVYPRISLCQSHNYIIPGITDSETLIDPAVYPEFELYPSVSVDETDGQMTAAVLSLYPLMRIYPIVYPYFEIYPGHISNGENDGVGPCGVSSPQPPILYPRFDIYCTGTSQDRLALPSTEPSSQYPAFNLYPPVSRHFEILPSAVPELGVSSTSRGSISQKARKTHKDLHEEVLGADALTGEHVQPAIARPQTGTHARGRVRSRTVISHLGSRQSLSSSPDSPPPVPSLLVSNLTARRGGLLPVATRNLADRPVSSHIAPPAQPSPIDDEGLVVQPNTLTSANSSQRKDHVHHKPNHRPRDSLVLEKARLLEHLHALSHDEYLSSTSSAPGKSAHLSASSVL